MLKKLVIALFLGSLALILINMGGVFASTLKVGVSHDIENFNPMLRNADQWPIAVNLYDTMLEADIQGNLLPALATSWEIDGNTIILKIREGVKFHNGKELTGEIVAENIEFAQDPSTGFHLYSAMKNISSIEVRNEYTLLLTVQNVSPYYILSQLVLLSVADPAAFPLESEGIGTGPFELESWIPGEKLVLKKNADYWQEGIPKVDEVVFIPYADPRALTDALKSRLIDWALPIPFEYALELQGTPGVIVEETAYPYHNIIDVHPAKIGSPFTNKKVRQAMQYALDREAFVNVGFLGFGEPKVNTYWSASSYYVEGLEAYYYYDPDRAKQLISEAGYPNGFEFTVTTSSGFPRFIPIAELLQEDLMKIGIKMNIAVQEPETWRTGLQQGTYEATFSFIGPDPSIIYVQSHFRPDASNVPWDGNPPEEYIDIVGRLQGETNEAAVIAAHVQAQVYFLDQSWTIMLCTRPQIFAWNDYVSGISWTPLNWPKVHAVEVSR